MSKKGCLGLILATWLLATVAHTAPQKTVAEEDATHHVYAVPEHAWTIQPVLRRDSGFNRGLALVRTERLDAAQLSVLPATEAGKQVIEMQVPLRNGKGAVRPLGKRQGGWYRVTARSRDGRSRAGTVVYFSNPGPAPREMLKHPLSGLDLSPVMLPREHRHYRARDTWPFVLRLNGRPVAGEKVLLETAGGTREVLVTDAQGVVEVTFPDDFRQEQTQAGGHGHGHNPGQAFVLSATIADENGHTMTAAFNFRYRPHAYSGKSLWLGAGFALLGMLSATPLLRGREDKGKVK